MFYDGVGGFARWIFLAVLALSANSIFAQGACPAQIGPTFTCRLSSVTYQVQVGSDPTPYSNGDAACASAGKPPSYRNGKFYVSYQNYGMGCLFVCIFWY